MLAITRRTKDNLYRSVPETGDTAEKGNAFLTEGLCSIGGYYHQVFSTRDDRFPDANLRKDNYLTQP